MAFTDSLFALCCSVDSVSEERSHITKPGF